MRVIGSSVLVVSLVAGSESWTPPVLVESTIPSPFSAGAGELALFEVRISEGGVVVDVIDLEEEASFAERFRSHILSWRFDPATTVSMDPASSAVLVAGVVSRSMDLRLPFEPWLETPEGVATTEEIPYPKRIVPPPFPPQAGRDGIVLLEVEIDDEGHVTEGKAVHSSNGYDGICLDTVEEWEFRPARREGRAVATRAYLLCNFRAPPKLRIP